MPLSLTYSNSNKKTNAMQFSTSKKYKTDSKMGGSFDLEFVEKTGGTYWFRVTNPGWEMPLFFTDTNINKVSEV